MRFSGLVFGFSSLSSTLLALTATYGSSLSSGQSQASPGHSSSARTKHARQKSKQQYPPKGMYHWGTDEKKRVRGCPSCPYNIKVGRCEVGLRKFPKITAVRRWYSSFGWNFRHNTTEWTFKNVVLAFQNVLTFENSLWWRLLVNDQKMGSQKLGAYEVRYKWKIQNSTSSVNSHANLFALNCTISKLVRLRSS